MKSRFLAHVMVLALAVSVFAGPAATPALADGGATRQVPLAGTGSPVTGIISGDGLSGPEFPGIEGDVTSPAVFNGIVRRSLSGRGGNSEGSQSEHGNNDQAKPQVTASFEGLNLFQQRYARRGNQFTVEPPDQGLCVGNGYIVEAVNDVVNMFNYSGASVLPNNTSTNIVGGHPTDVNHAVDLNSFRQRQACDLANQFTGEVPDFDVARDRKSVV